ncbi:alpha-mannosidase [Acidianus ambivalens]|uniref:Alpha-mannosidase n=1 Tax=Acidianus ambivalens TaxID=2283 RepID=A0A650CWA2_ACIAM|nr:glycoside hydrolase family 38 C-terminal domain-containing protein [Acidianus ambivalens]MQL54322.1 alpha-mannosidase [Acidianus ambivalens]QGR22149.1 alpha-mannosidase [Acidianus ambivalens]
MLNETEIRLRLGFLLANSYRNIKITEINGKTIHVLSGNYMVFLDNNEAIQLLVNNQPYFEIDSAHKEVPIPSGINELTLDSEYTGKIAFVNKLHNAYKLWVYGVTVLEASKYIYRDKLLEILSKTLSLVPFTSVSRSQLLVASAVWKDFPRHFLYFSNDMKYEEGGFDDDKYLYALEYLRKELSNLGLGKFGKIYGIAHAHIDAAWLWTFDETKRKIVRSFSTVLTLMSKYDFQFIQSSALYYSWIKDNFPELFNYIKRKVAEGKWILGAGWVEFDTNLPSGESLVRQLLYSQRFFFENFGRFAEVLWLPDSFGFSAQLPQIMRLSGIKYFATHKVFWNDTNKFPYSVFNWVGIDGSSVTAIAFGNGRGGYNSDFSVDSIYEQWNNWKDKDQPMLYSYGYGDGGGGPTEEMLIRAEAINYLPVLPKVNLKEIPKYEPKEIWKGEIYLEAHRGVYTSHSKMKYLHRKAEIYLREAELWSTIAGEKVDLKPLWLNLLKSEFHDILPGSAIKEVYNEVYKELENIIQKCEEIVLNSLRKISGEGDKIIAFNSLSWDREDYVISPFELPNSQKTDEGYLARIKIPSIGYSECNPERVDDKVRINGLTLENSILKVSLNNDGDIISIYDKEVERELLSKPSEIIAYENIPVWDAWDIEPSFKNTSFKIKANSHEIVENGPLRACIKFNYKFRNTDFSKRVCLYAKDRRIELRYNMKAYDRELLIKEWFYFNLNTDNATFEIPYGVINRSTLRNTSFDKAKFEVPFNKWLDLSEDNYGVTIISDTKQGSTVEFSSVGISLIKTPLYPDYESDFLEENSFKIYIYPHLGDWKKAQTFKRAYELTYPIWVTKGKGGSMSFLASDLIVEAIKPAEDRDGIIIRLYNIYNEKGKAKIRLWYEPRDVISTDLLESDKIKRKIKISRNEIEIEYNNYEIITLKIS